MTPVLFSLWIERLGFASAGLAAYFALLKVNPVSVALILMTMSFILQPAAWRACRREPVAWIALSLGAYLLGRLALAGMTWPESAAEQWFDGLNFLYLLLFVPMAWHLQGRPGRVHWVWGLALAGLLTGILGHLIQHGSADLLAGLRSGFHLRAIAFGLYAATALLGLLIFAPRLLGSEDRPLRPWRWALWLLILEGLLAGLLVTQSRGVLLAILVAFPLALWWRFRGSHWRCQPVWQRRLLMITGGLLLVQCLAVGGWVLHHRFAQESDTVTALERGALEDAPKTSISHRLWLWQFGLEKWQERPWLGWGPGATRRLVAESQNPHLFNDEDHRWMDHLHNAYLEILLRLGLVGAVWMTLLLVFLGRGLIRAYRDGRLARDHLAFLAGSALLALVWSAFDFRHLHWDWRDYWILLAGAGFSLGMRPTPPGVYHRHP
ncbi:MAG: O-antigen ligase family protein [Pseudomonadota bacterium]